MMKLNLFWTFVTVILQDWLIEVVHGDVAGISMMILSLYPRSKAVATGRSMLANRTCSCL